MGWDTCSWSIAPSPNLKVPYPWPGKAWGSYLIKLPSESSLQSNVLLYKQPTFGAEKILRCLWPEPWSSVPSGGGVHLLKLFIVEVWLIYNLSPNNIFCPITLFIPPASHSYIWRWPTGQSSWKPQESTESYLCRKRTEGYSTGARWDADEADFICWLWALHGSSDIPQTR